MLLTDNQIAASDRAGVALGPLIEFDEMGPEIWFADEGHLCTIAPTGAGKGQAHILRNLVMPYLGPVVVLDIKGENFDKSSSYRARNVGPVIRFAPFHQGSDDDDDGYVEAGHGVTLFAKYNPLEFVRSDNRRVWTDARLLADMMLVPEIKKDYWEERGRNLLSAVIAHVVLLGRETGAQPGMDHVLDVLSQRQSGWQSLWEDLEARSDIPELRRTATSFVDVPDKQFQGFLDHTRANLDIWQDPNVAAATRGPSSWDAEMFRTWDDDSIKPPSLYISIPVGEVRKYASLIRVILAQMLNGLYALGEAQSGSLAKRMPILFLLDELPQLGHMEPIVQALDVARSFGIRLWLFAQNMGQLGESYRNPEGMVDNCAVQAFMNPGHETASKLSQRLGYREGILNGKRYPLAEATDLTGPAYADKQIVFARGLNPATLGKRMAFQNSVLQERMDMPPPTLPPQPTAATEDPSRLRRTAER